MDSEQEDQSAARSLRSGSAVEDFYQEVSRRIPNLDLADVPVVGDRRDFEPATNTSSLVDFDWPRPTNEPNSLIWTCSSTTGGVSKQVDKIIRADKEASKLSVASDSRVVTSRLSVHLVAIVIEIAMNSQMSTIRCKRWSSVLRDRS
jgi:hypothetical protein